MADYDARDIKALFKELDAIEPGLVNKLRRDVRKVADPVVKGVKSAIPPVSPLSGMNNKGRLGWGVGKKALDVKPSITTKRSKKVHTTALVSVRVNSPATALTDYAGRRSLGKTKSGKAMIVALNRKRRASRWLWFGGEKALPATVNAVKGIIDNASKKISQRFE